MRISERAPQGVKPYDSSSIFFNCFNSFLCIVQNSFQEVVPLNAGNVFGAEDNKPIPKWDAIIRRTKQLFGTPGTKKKSYSAPPSPIRRNSSFDTQINPLDSALDKKEEIKSIISIEKNLQLSKIYDIDLQTILDWPELRLDPIHHVDSFPKLRRVQSTSDTASLYGFEMKSLHQSSGNLSLLWSEKQQEIVPQVFDSILDVSDMLSDEDNDTFSELGNNEDANGIISMKSQPKYVRIVSKQMVGIYVSVWVQRKLRRHVHHLKVSQVGVGLMGYMGNKVMLHLFYIEFNIIYHSIGVYLMSSRILR